MGKKKAIRLAKIADQYYFSNDMDLAENFYKQGLEIDPNNVDILNQLASIYFQQEKWSVCENILLKAYNLTQDDDTIITNLGALYSNLEQYQKAQKYLQEALKINPINDIAWNNMGVINQERHDYEEAHKYFRKAIEINPNELEYSFNIGETFEKQHKFREAKNMFEYILGLDKTNEDLLRNKIKQMTQNIERENIEHIKKLMQVSTKVKLDRFQDGLGMNNKDFNRKIVDWAVEFGFTIDGDYVIVNKSTIDDFIIALDHQFKDWEIKEHTKIGKT
jgi:tetratricopeptide (TPR) repeat protein